MSADVRLTDRHSSLKYTFDADARPARESLALPLLTSNNAQRRAPCSGRI